MCHIRFAFPFPNLPQPARVDACLILPPESSHAHSFLTICKNLKTGKITHIVSQFMMISPGILTTQVRPGCWLATH